MSSCVVPAAGSGICSRTCRAQSRYNERCRTLAPKLVLLWKALAAETLGAHDDLRLLDTTPLPCGQSIQTTTPSQLAPWAGFGYCPAHSRRYWGFKLVLLCAPDGTIVDFDLVAANTRRARRGARAARSQPDRGRHDHLRQRLRRRRVRSSRPRAARAAPATKPSRRAQTGPNPPIGWIRQRIESIVNTLKDQLLLERHGGRTPAGLLARVTARILALCACINLNQRLGRHSRELAAYAD